MNHAQLESGTGMDMAPLARFVCVGGAFLAYWLILHHKIWGVDAPFYTGLAIAVALGILALTPRRQISNPYLLITLGVIATVVLGRVLYINTTSSHSQDLAVTVALLAIPVGMIFSGIRQLITTHASD